MPLLKYTYKYIRAPAFDPFTGDWAERLFPMIPLQFKSENIMIPQLYGLLDSGSNCILIPKDISDELGLKLREAPPVIGVGGRTSRGIAEVDVKIGSHGRLTSLGILEISVLMDDRTIPVILGRDPIFKLYDISFSDSVLKVTLNPYKPKNKKKRRRRSERI